MLVRVLKDLNRLGSGMPLSARQKAFRKLTVTSSIQPVTTREKDVFVYS